MGSNIVEDLKISSDVLRSVESGNMSFLKYENTNNAFWSMNMLPIFMHETYSTGFFSYLLVPCYTSFPSTETD